MGNYVTMPNNFQDSDSKGSRLDRIQLVFQQVITFLSSDCGLQEGSNNLQLRRRAGMHICRVTCNIPEFEKCLSYSLTIKKLPCLIMKTLRSSYFTFLGSLLQSLYQQCFKEGQMHKFYIQKDLNMNYSSVQNPIFCVDNTFSI